MFRYHVWYIGMIASPSCILWLMLPRIHGSRSMVEVIGKAFMGILNMKMMSGGCEGNTVEGVAK